MQPQLQLHPETLPFLTEPEATSILVGVSGGRDSVALLSALLNIEGCSPVACHLHHGIRSTDADADASFVESLARKLHLPFYLEKTDVPHMAKESKISIETAARYARQDMFLRAQQHGLGSIVALGHHQNDQAETLLINLCRGGVGLKGMTPVSTWSNGLTVLRPFLHLSREEITAYLTATHHSWREDATNKESHYTRNALRNIIIPQLNEIMRRNTAQTMTRSARAAHQQTIALEQAIHHMDLIDPQGRLFLPKVLPLPHELQKAIVFHFLKAKHIPDLSEDSIERVVAILPPSSPSKIALHGNWIATRKEQRLLLLRVSQ